MQKLDESKVLIRKEARMKDVVPKNASTSRHAISRWQDARWTPQHDQLAEEVPVALEYNGISHAVMLATPADLEEFALGFSLSEGIITTPQELYGVEVEHGSAGITVRLEVSSLAFMALKERRRNLTGRTGCGLCGTESLDHVMRPLPLLAGSNAVSVAGIRHALAGLSELQPLNRITGALHAAAWCKRDGSLLKVFEDVGRHNALDKLIGAMAKAQLDFRDGFLLLTSRASVEMVQKAATVGISCMVAISAPTALAVRTAQATGMTLIAFARGEEFVGYAHAEKIELE